MVGANRAATDRVGVRELRQNLSVYLRRVMRGETLEVTQRGHAVAILGPLPESSSAVERLVAAGLALPAEGDLLDLPEPERGRSAYAATEALQVERDEGRR